MPGKEHIADGLTMSLHEVIPYSDCCPDFTIEENCADIAKDDGFLFVLQELVTNCWEKDCQEIKVKVGLTFDEENQTYRLVVSDNVSYEPEKLDQVLNNLAKESPECLDKGTIRKSGGSGAGKKMVERILKRWGGTLTYHADENRHVVAVAEWRRENFLHPLPQEPFSL